MQRPRPTWYSMMMNDAAPLAVVLMKTTRTVEPTLSKTHLPSLRTVPTILAGNNSLSIKVSFVLALRNLASVV